MGEEFEGGGRTDVEDGLSPAERAALSSLTRERRPPAAVEERVVESLRGLGLVRPRRTWLALAPRAGLAVAASLALFAAGLAAGARWWSSSAAAGAGGEQAEFMLVLRALPAEAGGTADDEMRRVREYTAWAREMGRDGVLVGGEKLEDEARVLRAAGGRAEVSELRAAAPGESIAGYFLIRARDFTQAAEIAGRCPHVRHGGTVEVRRIARL